MLGISHEYATDGSICPGCSWYRQGKLFISELCKQLQTLLTRGGQISKDLLPTVVLMFFDVRLVTPINPGKHFFPTRCARPTEADGVQFSRNRPTNHPLERSLNQREMHDVIVWPPGCATRDFTWRSRDSSSSGVHLERAQKGVLVRRSMSLSSPCELASLTPNIGGSSFLRSVVIFCKLVLFGRAVMLTFFHMFATIVVTDDVLKNLA